MPRINILPKSVAELIAAGEVVERPASAVKELIENSVDAQADSITVEIRNGGIKYIRVADNGCGISREDAPCAFISHATSKIKTGADLQSVLTLGFRGEALPSIAAVSRLTMLTKTDYEETGTVLEEEGGEIKSVDEAGCPKGTTVTVRDLFYNTPARMKFLKKDMTEAAYVGDTAAKAAIAHPEIRFSFIKDGKTVFSTPGNGDLRSAVYAALGRQISEGLIECVYEYQSIKIKGLISKPLNNRPNRNMQYFYVNGRFVRVPAASSALDEAYKNRIMVGKFPACFLDIEISPEKTDVNVHPSKTEIRFSDDAKIFEAVYYAAVSALSIGDKERPKAVLADKRGSVLEKKQKDTPVQLMFSAAGPPVQAAKIKNDEKTAVQSHFSQPEPRITSDVFRNTSLLADNIRPRSAFINETAVSASFNAEPQKKRGSIDIFADDDETAAEKNTGGGQDIIITGQPVGAAEKKQPEFQLIGEVFKTYILAQSGNSLLIIDKHAAHERMIFNSLKARGEVRDSQILMLPVSVPLSGKEYAAVLENLDIFSKGGFLVEDFGKNTVIVRECPITLDKEDISAIIAELAGELERGNLRPAPEKLDWLYNSTACRAAVKAGDELRSEELCAFVQKLLEDDSVRYCPHGRPVMYELSKYEIEKQFGRVQ